MLDGAGGQRHASTALTPGKIRYPVYRTLGGFQGLSGWMRKVSPPPGFSLQTVQPLASLCTDCAVLAPDHVILTAFPLQQWLHEGSSMLHYTYITYIVV